MICNHHQTKLITVSLNTKTKMSNYSLQAQKKACSSYSLIDQNLTSGLSLGSFHLKIMSP